MKNFLIKSIVLFIIFISGLKAETVTFKCHIDEEKSYSFILDKKEKKVQWLDQNNQNMNVAIFPDVDKGGYLLIMGGVGSKDEKHTFVINVVKSVVSVTTNLGYNKSGKCGNRAIIEPKDIYAD
tara:strand:+ start:2037 stop:2408 length:372 start_codon:yes stop_codon:yes gene_type:complete